MILNQDLEATFVTEIVKSHKSLFQAGKIKHYLEIVTQRHIVLSERIRENYYYYYYYYFKLDHLIYIFFK
jgi:hypothetical protein